MLGHPTPSCKFYKLEKCERGNDCKFKHEDCTNDDCNSADCKLAHPNRNKRTNMHINPISVDSTFNSHRPEKRMKTTCPTLPATLPHDSNSEDVLQPQTITASSENKNKRKWRKHTSKETRERIQRREERKKLAHLVFTVRNSASEIDSKSSLASAPSVIDSKSSSASAPSEIDGKSSSASAP